MNERHEKLLRLMAAYDAAAVGSPERIEFGRLLDKEVCKLKDRDVWQIQAEYEARHMKGKTHEDLLAQQHSSVFLEH